MTHVAITLGVCLEDEHALDIDALAVACGCDVDFIQALLADGLLQPVHTLPPWRFGGEALARVRRIRRLQHDFEAPLASVAVMLDLLDQIDELRAQLCRVGLA